MAGRVWTLTQTDDTIFYHVYKHQDKQKNEGDRKRRADVCLLEENKEGKRFKKEGEDPVTVAQTSEVEEGMLRDYFRLNVNLGDLYREWAAADCHFRNIARIFTGQCLNMHDTTINDRYSMCFVKQVSYVVFFQVSEC